MQRRAEISAAHLREGASCDTEECPALRPGGDSHGAPHLSQRAMDVHISLTAGSRPWPRVDQQWTQDRSQAVRQSTVPGMDMPQPSAEGIGDRNEAEPQIWKESPEA